MDFSKVKPMPERVILRISSKDREGIFEKSFRRPDGTSFKLIVTVDEEKGFDRKATLFVRTAEVMSVGRKVRNIQAGDIAIMDYLVDNDESVVLGWENGDKYVSVIGQTSYYEKEVWAYANRQQPKPTDIRVAKKGSVQNVSQILGVIRDGVLTANDPYVFIEHKSKDRETSFGFKYQDTKDYCETTVVAVSRLSSEKYGIEVGRQAIVKYQDLFDIELDSGTICAFNDEDIIHQL